MRIVFLATHPGLATGYSKIANMVTNYLAAQEGVELVYICTSNTNPTENIPRYVHPNIKIIDAVAESVRRGSDELYGINILEEIMYAYRPDIFFIYNDIIVTCRAFNALLKYRSEVRRTKFVSYIDLVYPFERLEYIQHLDRNTDMILTFSDYWKQNLVDMGVSAKKIRVFYHGVNREIFHLEDRSVGRKQFGFTEDDFIILNTNRNCYRKAHDISLRAFLLFLKRENMNPRIKMFINFSLNTSSGYHYLDLMETECLKLGIPLEKVMNGHIFQVPGRSGNLTDTEINTLYNMADIGINTCLGEGFGLCNVEQAVLGKVQVVSAVGAFRDIFAGETDMLVEPRTIMSVPAHMDGHAGDLHICDASDFADRLQYYFHNPTKRLEDGKRIAKKFGSIYDWDTLLPKMYSDLQKLMVSSAL